MTYHRGGAEIGPARLTCDTVTGYRRIDPPPGDVIAVEEVRCIVQITGGSAAYLRDVARREGWQVRRKLGTGYVDLCPQHRIAYRNPTPWGRRR